MTTKKFLSTKTYTHAEGLSCCFRQWRAAHSHCRFLHGYAIEVRITFGCRELDERNWVQDFGGLKSIKQWLKEMFDHKTLVAKDDPLLSELHSMKVSGLIDLVIVDAVGCEKFAEMIFDHVHETCSKVSDGRVWVESVEVREHAGNSAICQRA